MAKQLVGPAFEALRKCSEPPQLEEFGVAPEAIQSFHLAMGNWLLGGVHGFWLEPECGDGHCDPNNVVYAIGTRLHELSNAYNGNDIRSPIEARMLAALLWLEIDWAGFPLIDGFGEFDKSSPFDPSEGLSYYITLQAPVADYRVDLMLWFACGKVRGGVAIECDGHDFHEKTKEQAARDKKRDREILAAGYPVMRFTGSEIFRDAVACAEQVRDVAAEVLFRVSKEGGLF